MSATILYSAPELELQADQPRSRLYDIWCIGCIYLEFVIWLLYGWNGLGDFRDQIGRSPQKGTFYTLEGQPPRPLLHPVVDKWVGAIKDNKRCARGTAMGDLVHFIADRLLNPHLPPPQPPSPSKTKDSAKATSIEFDDPAVTVPSEAPIQF